MAIRFTRGDIFASGADVLVNAVNCVGVMGAGLAAAFRQRFPEVNEDYVRYCQAGKLKPGEIHLSVLKDVTVFNVATKDHYIHDSRYEWLEAALKNVAKHAREIGVKTVAMPALGCGLGGLDWNVFKKMIEDNAGLYDDIELIVYEPL